MEYLNVEDGGRVDSVFVLFLHLIKSFTTEITIASKVVIDWQNKNILSYPFDKCILVLYSSSQILYMDFLKMRGAPGNTISKKPEGIFEVK